MICLMHSRFYKYLTSSFHFSRYRLYSKAQYLLENYSCVNEIMTVTKIMTSAKSIFKDFLIRNLTKFIFFLFTDMPVIVGSRLFVFSRICGCNFSQLNQNCYHCCGIRKLEIESDKVPKPTIYV